MFDDLVEQACAALAQPPLRIPVGEDYEGLLAAGASEVVTPADKRSLLSINYTSGTTGKPKGMMYHHRGAYLQASAMAGHTGLSPSAVHLWTLPMFHCNGWCFPWAVTAAAATHMCLPKVDPSEVWRLIREQGVTHLNGAPTVLSMLAYAPEAAPASPTVRVATGARHRRRRSCGGWGSWVSRLTHLYGLTETFGPVMICDWRSEWTRLDAGTQALLKARQGVGNMISCRARVLGEDGRDVPCPGRKPGYHA